MNNWQIVDLVEAFREAREGWVKSAVERDSVEAAKFIMSCNAKIELLLSLWNWSDESVEYPHYHKESQ